MKNIFAKTWNKCNKIAKFDRKVALFDKIVSKKDKKLQNTKSNDKTETKLLP